MTTDFDLEMMSLAIDEAKKAERLGEVPIGAVISQNGQVIATGHNLRETGRHTLAHAEIIALDAACKTLGGWRLPNCTLYVTLEPCPMCAGAIINARIVRVVFGAYDSKAGSFGSLVDLSKVAYNHAPQLCGGVMETECAALLRDFFRNLRQR
ncbi:MAG: nucleoside deaminase [Oscillospiraceae bacterium]|jgi:tRNA(adenine34) deaminase|nr:nucleoside deaminase [Oscillospiraceae bacterium]